MILDVTDEEILNAQRILAELEGIFCLPASATALAGLIKLSENRKFKANDQIVLVIIGSGLKAVKAMDTSKINIHHTALLNLEEKIKSLFAYYSI